MRRYADGTYDENSYSSPDSVNNLKWEQLTKGSDQYATMQYYKGLIAFRKSCPTLRLTSSFGGEDGKQLILSIVNKDGAFVAIQILNPVSGEKVLVVYNANTADKTFTLPAGRWSLFVDGERAGSTALESGCTGDVSVSKISCFVYKAEQ